MKKALLLIIGEGVINAIYTPSLESNDSEEVLVVDQEIVSRIGLKMPGMIIESPKVFELASEGYDLPPVYIPKSNKSGYKPYKNKFTKCKR